MNSIADSSVSAPPDVGPFNPLSVSLRNVGSAVRGALRDHVAPHVGALTGARRATAISSADRVSGRIGPLEVRLARNAADVRRAQRLRYRVFFQEMSAVSRTSNFLTRRDMDRYDPICDHLLVCDHRGARVGGHPKVVGTYRLLRQAVAARHGGFYSAREFSLHPLLQRHGGLSFLELGRSCVLPAYRGKRTVELLWQGIWSYVMSHGIDAMIGCASFDAANADEIAHELSFLHHYASAPPEWQVCALPSRYVEMNRLPKSRIDAKAVMHVLPPLIKGYLRLGAFVGRGAVIDRTFGTVDVPIVLPVAAIKQRYVDRFSDARAERAA